MSIPGFPACRVRLDIQQIWCVMNISKIQNVCRRPWWWWLVYDDMMTRAPYPSNRAPVRSPGSPNVSGDLSPRTPPSMFNHHMITGTVQIINVIKKAKVTNRPPLKRILRRKHMLKAPGAGVVAPEEVFGGKLPLVSSYSRSSTDTDACHWSARHDFA